MVEDRSIGARLYEFVNYSLLAALALLCLIPLIHLLAVSLSSKGPSEANLVGLWPLQYTTANYERILNDGRFQRSFWITVTRTGLGTAIQMVLTTLTAYPLSLAAGFRGQQAVKWLLIFGMLFSGGLIPMYLAVRSLHMLDTMWALVLPTAIPIWNTIILVNFFRGLPSELAEAAELDGASHWDILLRIYIPLSKPALATLTLFCAVAHWNSWFDGLIYMAPGNFPLQSYLQSTVISDDFTGLLGATPDVFALISQRSLRAAQVFFATIPILILYPFLQRYFVQGLTLGSLKG